VQEVAVQAETPKVFIPPGEETFRLGQCPKGLQNSLTYPAFLQPLGFAGEVLRDPINFQNKPPARSQQVTFRITQSII